MPEFLEVLAIAAAFTAAIFWLSGTLARLFVVWITWASLPTLVTGDLPEAVVKVIRAGQEVAPDDMDAVEISGTSRHHAASALIYGVYQKISVHVTGLGTGAGVAIPDTTTFSQNFSLYRTSIRTA
jgi:hypothetical protein